MLSTQPIYILREVLQYLENHRIVIPGYTFLQDMVGRVVTGERRTWITTSRSDRPKSR
jgi:hypothetical protein